MNRPKLLDLFCCAGGAAMGYYRAGFDVTGVDIKPQPHYPFEFHQADALTYPLEGFDAYHASPPCQAFSTLTPTYAKSRYPDLIDPIRQRFLTTGKPYIIENVAGAKHKLINPLMLCGSMFALPIWRHRYFEINPPYYAFLNTCNHKLGTTMFAGELIEIPVYISAGGDSLKGPRPSRLTVRHRPRQLLPLKFKAMGIDWMSGNELSEAIPPAYTEYIGKFLMKEIESQNNTAILR